MTAAQPAAKRDLDDGSSGESGSAGPPHGAVGRFPDIGGGSRPAPTRTTVSTILRRLENRGLVTCSGHPTTGGEMIEHLLPEVERGVTSWFGGHFSKEETTALADLPRRV